MKPPRLSASERLRIIVLGYSVRWPVGGMLWHYLQYVLGLSRLGHDVYFVEDSDDYDSCWNPSTKEMGANPSFGIRFTSRVFKKVGLGERWAYYDGHTERWLGPAAQSILSHCASADLLLNVSGVNPLRPWMMRVPARVMIDTDPGFTQVRHLTDRRARSRCEQHTTFLSFGENYGNIGCEIPDDGFAWQPTRQPIVLDAWAVSDGPKLGEFRTLMQWDSYPSCEYNGLRYGMKSDSLQPFFGLPTRVTAPLGIAASRLPKEIEQLLRKHEWNLHDPEAPSHDPWSYQDFLRNSKAEFTVAKQGYVVSHSGWFSERSACYLATGRPVVTQETGFSRWLPTGDGILSFTSMDQAAQGIREVDARYRHHCTAAREIADAYFDSRHVLTELLHRVFDTGQQASLDDSRT